MIPSKNLTLYGSVQDLPEQTLLQAGTISALYEAGTLRRIKLGDSLILMQIYAAVRDHNWDTIPAILSDVSIVRNEDSFRVSFISHHQRGDIDFVWKGSIEGDPNGTIRFDFDGEALSSFSCNRVGFCVLHPATCAGQACVIEHVDGGRTEGMFPELISPYQPFFDIRAISHSLNGATVRVLMEGDTFEMEDQRNWTDASYKTYCTPLGLPFPVKIEAGTCIQQKITIQLEGKLPEITSTPNKLVLHIGNQSSKLPQIGLGTASHGRQLTEHQLHLLRDLNVSHIRLDLRLYEPDWSQKLQQSSEEILAIDTKVELVVFISNDAQIELQALGESLKSLKIALRRIIVFHRNEKSTQAKWLSIAREYLSDFAVPIGAGTDAFFTEINRERPPVTELDFLSYSLNPQVHAFDNDSLVETLSVQATTVDTCRSFSDDKPIVVSPVTFKMRWNPNATSIVRSTPKDELADTVDTRQMSLFGAGWTLGSIKYLAQSGAESITYYETSGLQGIMATEDVSPLPDKFYAPADSVYPMFAVFKWILANKDAQIIHCRSSAPYTFDGITLRDEDSWCVLLANFTPEIQSISVKGLKGDFRGVALDESNVKNFVKNPFEVLNSLSDYSVIDQQLIVTLKPFAIMQLISV